MQGAYDTLALLELRRLPALWRAVQTMPETAPIRAWLNQEGAKQEDDAASQQEVAVTSVRKKSRLQVLALGEPRVLVDNILITRWRMARSMEIFFLLLERGGALRKEQMIAAFWPDAGEEIDQTLRSVIYYLRRALGEACLLYHGGMYTLNLTDLYGENIQYDVAVFLAREATAKQALAADDNETARKAFREMVNLYQGDYVQSFYSDWCMPRRDELRRIYLDARRQLARLAWREEIFDESALHWQHILAVDKTSEVAHYGLMQYYLHQGKRDMALRQYQHCRAILHEEFAATPGPPLQKLYQRLISTGKES